MSDAKLSQIRLEICLGIINQENPSVFALQVAQDIIACDPYVKSVLTIYGVV